MAVKFHCSQCGKLIRAPKDAAGKRGKCPYCKQSVYIPTPEEELEAIPLAPLDEDSEQRRSELEREAEQIFAALDQDEESAAEQPAAPTPGARGRNRTHVDVHRLVIGAVKAMQESRLEQATRFIRELRQQPDRARDHIQALIIDEMTPAEIENCPSALYKGFLRKILESL